MSTTRAMLLGLLVPVLVSAAGVEPLWIQQYTGNGNQQYNEAAEILTDDSGYVYVCGSGEKSYDYNTDMLLAVYNEWGERETAYSYGGNTYSPLDMAHAMAMDSAGNVFVVGATENNSPRFMDGSYFKCNRDTFLYGYKTLFPDDDAVFDVAVGNHGDLYMCGVRSDTTDSIASQFSLFLVMRLDPEDFDTIWTRAFFLDTYAFARKGFGKRHGRDRHPDFFDDYDDWDNCATAMDITPGGNIVVTGFGLHGDYERDWWTMKFDTAGNRLWQATHHHPVTLYHDDDVAFDIEVAPNGDIYVCGFDYHERLIEEEWWNFAVVRYDSSGTVLDSVSFNQGSVDGDDIAYALCLDQASRPNVYVTGVYEWPVNGGDYQVGTHKLTYELNREWGTYGASYGGDSTDDFGYDVSHAGDRVYVAADIDGDLGVICYDDASGVPQDSLWDYVYDSPDTLVDFGCAVTAEDSDRVYVAGTSYRYAAGPPWTSMYTARLFYPDPDIALDAILAPSGDVNLGDTIAPQVRVVNQGNTRAVYTAYLTIEPSYSDSVLTLNWLYPGDTSVLSFADWVAQPSGTLAVRCSLAMPSDSTPANNVLVESVRVAVHDVACLGITAPTGVLDSGVTVTPSAWVKNLGGVAETFDCSLAIGGHYSDVVTVTGLAPGDSVAQAFAIWNVLERGPWPVVCTTMLGMDSDHSNDRAQDSVTVRVVDAALLGIMALPDTVDSGTVIQPGLQVSNQGTQDADAWVYLMLEDDDPAVVYFDSVRFTLRAEFDTMISLPGSEPVSNIGFWRATTWVVLAGDMHPENDSQAKSFFVRPFGISWPMGWREVASVPLTPSGKQVKRGGWLAMNDGDGRIYAQKGYKTNDFYSYDYMTDQWTTLPGMPYMIHPLWGRKPPRKGSKGITDGGEMVYVTQGNNTTGFWRYKTTNDTWTMLAEVPTGPSRKKVKGGTDLVYVVKDDVPYVYMLKGYRTEFYRYNIGTDEWEPLPDAPTGARNKWDKGSFLVYDGVNTIYAHKAKYNELWQYDVSRDTWVGQLTGMPFVGSSGRKKKAKDGSAGAWFDRRLWALKGGNTQEFWCYFPRGDTWRELDTMPANGSTGRKKRVKYGADLVYAAYAFWALKGNKTVEAWRYGIPFTFGDRGLDRPARSGVAAGVTHTPRGWEFYVHPNPLGGDGMMHYSVPVAAVVRAAVFDAAGRKVRALFTGMPICGSGTMRLDTEGLAAGVYVLNLDVGGTEAMAGRRLSYRLVVR